MKRRLVTHRGKRVRRSGAGKALALLFAAVGLCLLASSEATHLVNFIDADFFAAALAHEYPSHRADSLLELALTPAVSFITEPEDEDELSSVASPSAAPTASPSPTPSPLQGVEPSSSPVPSREPNSADLDPNIRTVTIAPNSPDSYSYADGVYIKNGTKFDIDVSSYLEALPEFEGMPHILIVHTHTCEAYYPDGDDMYEPTDTERTEDVRYNVVRVGDELETLLTDRGFEVTHIRDVFDYPSYNGSYARALEAITASLEMDEKIQIVIDLHRDAIEGADGSTWRAVSDVDGRYAAQSMFVIGTDEGGLDHPNWRKNLLFAVHLQKYIVDRYPTLMRPISLTSSRYNQHATAGSLILEVGTSGNTLDEAIYSAQLFGEALGDFLVELCS